MSLLDAINQLVRGLAPEWKDVHKHRCGYYPRGFDRVYGCGLVFEHERPPQGTPHLEYQRAHECPGCGRVNTWRYDGRVPVGQTRLKQETVT